MRILSLLITFVLVFQMILLGIPGSENYIYALGERARERVQQAAEERRESRTRGGPSDSDEENSSSVFTDIANLLRSFDFKQEMFLIRVPRELLDNVNRLESYIEALQGLINALQVAETIREKQIIIGQIIVVFNDLMGMLKDMSSILKDVKYTRLDRTIFFNPETFNVSDTIDEKLLFVVFNQDSTYTMDSNNDGNPDPDYFGIYCYTRNPDVDLYAEVLMNGENPKFAKIDIPEIKVGNTVLIPKIFGEVMWGFIDTTKISDYLSSSDPYPDKKFEGRLQVTYNDRASDNDEKISLSKEMKLKLDKQIKIIGKDDNGTFSLGDNDKKFTMSTVRYDNSEIDTEFPSLLKVGLLMTHKKEIEYNFLRELIEDIRVKLCEMLDIASDSDWNYILFKICYPDSEPPEEGEWNDWYDIINEIIQNSDYIDWIELYFKTALIRVLDLEDNATNNEIIAAMSIRLLKNLLDQGVTDIEPLIHLDSRIIDMIIKEIDEREIDGDGEFAYILGMIKNKFVNWIKERDNSDPKFKPSLNIHAPESLVGKESKVTELIEKIELVQELLCGKDESEEPILAILSDSFIYFLAGLIVRSRHKDILMVLYITTRCAVGRLLNLLEYFGKSEDVTIPQWLIDLYDAQDLRAFVVSILRMLGLDSDFLSAIWHRIESYIIIMGFYMVEEELENMKGTIKGIIYLLVRESEAGGYGEYEGLLEVLKDYLILCGDIVIKEPLNIDGILTCDADDKVTAVDVEISPWVIKVSVDLINLYVDKLLWQKNGHTEDEINRLVEYRLRMIIVYLCNICGISIDVIERVNEDGTVVFKSPKDILIEISSDSDNIDKIRIGLLPLFRLTTDTVDIVGQRWREGLKLTVTDDDKLQIEVEPEETDGQRNEQQIWALAHVDFSPGDLYKPDNKLDVGEPFIVVSLQKDEKDVLYKGDLSLKSDGLPVSDGQTVRVIVTDILDLDMSDIAEIEDLKNRISNAKIDFLFRMGSIIKVGLKRQRNKKSNEYKKNRFNNKEKKGKGVKSI